MELTLVSGRDGGLTGGDDLMYLIVIFIGLNAKNMRHATNFVRSGQRKRSGTDATARYGVSG